MIVFTAIGIGVTCGVAAVLIAWAGSRLLTWLFPHQR